MLETIKALKQSDDTISNELNLRYGLEKEIWLASQRKLFPFNTSLLMIFSLCILGILLALCHPARILFTDFNLLKCMATTTLFSLLAFVLTDAGILEFKSKLESKGIFGRDLNKIGDHRDDTKEKM